MALFFVAIANVFAGSSPTSSAPAPSAQATPTAQAAQATQAAMAPASADSQQPAVVAPNPTLANSATISPATKPATSPVVTSSPTSLASGLIFLLALVLVAAWLVKRSGGMPAWRGGGSMKVVSALSVGPRERVLLIELGGQQWLLGVTPSAVNKLHHFPEPIIAAGSADEFSNKLRQLLPQGFGK